MEEVYLRHGKWRTFAVFTEVHLNRNRDVVSSVRSVPRCQQFRPTFCPFLVADMQAFIRSPNAANSFPISLHDSLASWLSSFASQIFCLLVPVSSEFVLLWSIQTKKKLPFEKDFGVCPTIPSCTQSYLSQQLVAEASKKLSKYLQIFDDFRKLFSIS